MKGSSDASHCVLVSGRTLAIFNTSNSLEERQVHSNIQKQVRSFPRHPCLPPTTSLPSASSPQRCSWYMGGPTWTHRCHPQPWSPLGHTQFCTVYGSAQMCDDIIHHLGIARSSFTALKTLCAPPVHPSDPSNPRQPLNFHHLHSFAFPRRCVWPFHTDSSSSPWLVFSCLACMVIFD